MRALARRVGLGIAARGDISDTIDWTRRARDAGLDSVWIHDTPYERDSVTYGSAIAAALSTDPTDRFRVGLGAVNPYTRHPAVLAMTGSGLDEILPERIVMAIGTGLPFRLAQMGIPYSPAEAVERVGDTLDQLRTMWAGQRWPSKAPDLPPIQPMFPPVHRIPLFIAAYRKEFVELAGQKADGYLARPCESIPSLRGILERLRASATAAGRNPGDIETAAYLLSLVDKTRREALNRAKREPFVIYMMSILGDVSLQRAGFPREMRDRIAAAWKAEDFHEAGKLIPDDLLDAFMLCGTREDVAAKAMAFHAETGLDLPLLQPVLQEERQVEELIESARLYAALPLPAAMPERAAAAIAIGSVAEIGAGAHSGAADPDSADRRPSSLDDDRRLTLAQRARRRSASAWEIVRPFAFTGSFVPITAGATLAAVDGRFSWPLFLAALAAGILIQSGTNVVNEVFDVRRGIDTITSPRASHAVLKGRFTERGAYLFAVSLFAAACAIGIGLAYVRGPAIIALGVLGIVAGYTYTAPPFQYKYKAVGLPMIFLIMGPIMTVGSYYAVSGSADIKSLVLSVPVGLLVAAIVHGNDWRDIGDDSRAGVVTPAILFGREWAHYAYIALVLGAYVSLALSVAARLLPPTTAIAVLSLPFLAQVVRSAELGATGQARAIAMIDIQTARLHFAFGSLLVVGLLLARPIP
jgi:1,4-dihydroxy-2-naphthoate octaprenyltransferase